MYTSQRYKAQGVPRGARGRTRLRLGLGALEVVSGLVVPEVHAAVVAAGDEDVVAVHGHGIDDGVVPCAGATVFRAVQSMLSRSLEHCGAR